MSKYIRKDEVVDCDGCGLMVRKEHTIRGQSEIRKRINPLATFAVDVYEDYIYVLRYCRLCHRARHEEPKQGKKGTR